MQINGTAGLVTGGASGLGEATVHLDDVAFDRWIADFRGLAPRGLPGLGNALSDLAGALQRSTGDALVREGTVAHARV